MGCQRSLERETNGLGCTTVWFTVDVNTSRDLGFEKSVAAMVTLVLRPDRTNKKAAGNRPR